MTNTMMRSLVRPKLLAMGLSLLTLVGCEAKEPGFFAPATDIPGGGGSSFPTLVQLNGQSVTVNYNWISTTCETSTPADFTAPADLSTSGTTLNIQFPDAPVPISGVYMEASGDYDGDTGPVDIGSGLFANEMWMTDFSVSGNMVSMTGTSFVDVTSGGSSVCNRQFNVSFIFTF